jgi:hypothetical protein
VVARLAGAASAREAERGSGITWRALDLGVPGYHIGQALRAFEQDGLALQPDVIIYYFNTNDIEQTGFYFDQELGVLRRDYLPLPDGLKRVCALEPPLRLHRRPARARGRGRAHARTSSRACRGRTCAPTTRNTCRRVSRAGRAVPRARVPFFVIDQPLMTSWRDAPRGLAGGAARRMVPRLCSELDVPAVHLMGWIRGYADGVDRFDLGVPPTA